MASVNFPGLLELLNLFFSANQFLFKSINPFYPQAEISL
jgi:hypothetical protein